MPVRLFVCSTQRNGPLTAGGQIYILAQLFGGFVGAAVVYATYYNAINIVEGGTGVRTLETAGLFATYAVSAIIPPCRLVC